MTLIPDWRSAHKFFSVIIGAIVAMLALAVELLPSVKALISPNTFPWLVFALSVLGVGGRYIKQNLAVTPEEKVALIETAAAQPLKAAAPIAPTLF